MNLKTVNLLILFQQKLFYTLKTNPWSEIHNIHNIQIFTLEELSDLRMIYVGNIFGFLFYALLSVVQIVLFTK